jgi:chromosome segregation ATPase
LGERRERQLVELDKLRDESESLQRELTDLEDTRGEYYREAVSAIRERLAEIDARDLASNARRTPSLTDDQIVARIQGVDQKLDDLDGDTRRHHDEIRDMQRCIEALGRLIQRFRAAKFDAARSHFEPSLDILDLLHRAKNEGDIDDVWDRLRRAQRWGPTLSKQLGNVASHPMSQVLIGAMALAAGAARKDHTDRAARRRGH